MRSLLSKCRKRSSVSGPVLQLSDLYTRTWLAHIPSMHCWNIHLTCFSCCSTNLCRH